MKGSTFTINTDLLWICALGIFTLAAAVYMATHSIYMIILIPAALIIASLLLTYDEPCLAAAIIILPFASSLLLRMQLLPLPGARIINILLVLLLIGYLLNRKLNFKGFKAGVLFYAGSITLFIIAILRSGHVSDYALQFWLEDYQLFKFFLSHGLIPLLITIPFLMIIGRIRTEEETQRVAYYLALSVILLAAAIIGIYIVEVPAGSEFYTTRTIIGFYLGMHGNNLADFIIVGFPLMLAMAMIPNSRYQKIFFLGASLALVAATLIYSRTAYLTILLSIPAILALTRWNRLIIPFIALLVMVIVLMPGVTERAVTGLEEGEHDIITAGRIDYIWQPALIELRERVSTNPMQISFGLGRYGIMDLQAYRNQRMLQTTHAHNMYLDTMLDIGAAGLLFYISMIAYVLDGLIKAFYRQKKKGRNSELYITAGLLVAITSFLVRGASDSFLLPHLTNSYFYTVMAISFVVLNRDTVMQKKERGE